MLRVRPKERKRERKNKRTEGRKEGRKEGRNEENSYAEALTPNVMIFGDGTFGTLELNKVILKGT